MSSKEQDTKVLAMQFDSRDFDKNIRKSQKTLADFKKELNFNETVKQMQGLDESNSILAKMSANIQKLTSELTGVGTVSSYVAQKIQGAWHGAINSVENFAKSLTTVQQKAGSEKYNKLLKSVQTIKNATGDTEDVVYGVMEKLNKYTDETSYDFADMAQNIGKFTTAGVGLSDAEQEMEGIANWAALAGQGITEAQRAMYNISQAMSAGYMAKIDYKSIQNANMDIQKFRKEALEAAVAAGTLKKAKDGVYKTVKGGKQVTLQNFVETLQYKWFDKATMEKVFKTFGNNTEGIGEEAYKAAQRCVTLQDAIGAIKDMLSTGWMQTYQHIFGKLSDAMGLFSGLCNKASEAISQFIEVRNGILAQWSFTGRDSLWGALVGEMETPDGETLFKGAYGLLDLIIDVGNQIHDAFVDFVLRFVDENNRELYKNNPDKLFAYLANGLTKVTDGFRDFTTQVGHFFNDIPAGETESRMDKIRHIIETIYSIVMLVSMVFGGIASFVGQILAQLRPAFDSVFSLFSYIGQVLTGNVVNSAKTNSIGNFFHILAETLRPVTSIINAVVPALATVIGKVVEFLNATGLLQPALIGLIAGKIVGLLGALNQKKGVLGFIGKIFGGKFGGATKIITIVSALIGLVSKLTGIDIGKGAAGWIQNLIGKAGTYVPVVKQSLKNVWTTVKATIKTWLSDLAKNGPSLVTQLKGKTTAILEAVKTFFSDLVKKVVGFFVGTAKADAPAEATTAVENAIASIVVPGGDKGGTSATSGPAKSIIQKLKDAFSGIWEPIKNFFTTFFNETIPNFFNSPAMQGVGKFFNGTTFMGLLGGITNLVKWLAIFRSGSGLVKMGKGIGKIGKGIGIFGKNLKKLNLVDAFKNMFNFTNIINSNNVDNSKTSNWTNFGNGLLKIAAAFGIVVVAAIKLSDAINAMSPEQLTKTGIALGALFAALVASDILTKKFGGGGGGILKLAAGIALLILPLKTLMGLGPFRTLTGELTPFSKALLTLAGILVTVGIAARLAGGKGAKGLLSMAIGINLLMIPLKTLMGLGPLRTLTGELTPFSKALLALVGLMITMGVAERIAGKSKFSGIISVSIALVLLMKPLRELAQFNTEEYLQAIFGISAIMLAMAGLVHVAKGAKLTSLAGVVAAVAALSFIGTLIGKMPLDQVFKGFTPIVLMLLSMTALVSAAKKLNTEQIKGLQTIFVTFAVVVGVISGSLVALTALGAQESMLIEFFSGLILMLGMMGVALRLARKTDAKAISRFAVVMGVFSVVVGVITGSLIVMTKMGIDWKTILAMLGGLSVLIAVMGTFLPKLAKLDIKGALIAALAMGVVVVAVMGAVALMAKVLLNSVGSAIQDISLRLKTTSGMLKDFFDRMQTITEESVKHAGVVFDGVKDIILKFVGFGNHSADIRSVTSQLNQLGTGLDLFFLNESLYPASEDSKALKLINKFVEIGPSLAAFSVGNMPAQLMYLGVGLGLFNDATKNIPDGEVPALSLLEGIFGQADNIEKFIKLPLDSFREQMSGLGGAMSLYAKGAKEVTGIDAEADAPDITDAIGILNAVAQAMSGEGENGFVIPDNIPSSAELGLFAGQLESLGNALSTYAKAAHDMETDTGNATKLLEFLGTIGGYLTEDNLEVTKAFENAGVTSGSDGKSGTLGQFALDIGALGTALSNFAGSIKNKDFQPGIDALGHFSELNGKLTAENLIFANVFNDANIHQTVLDSFATDIASLGRALKSFAQNVTMDDGTQADFNYALRAINFLSVMSSRLSDSIKIGGLHDLLFGTDYTLGELGDDVQILGQSLSDLSTKLTTAGEEGGTFDYENVMKALNSVQALIGIMQTMNHLKLESGEQELDVGNYVFMLNSLLYALTDEELAHLQGRDKSIAGEFAEFAKSISDAFGQAGDIDTVAIDTFQRISQSLYNLTTIDPSLNFEYPGQMIASGIATGIKNGESEVVNAVVAVVNSAINAGNTAAEIESPSRVFAEMGRYMDLGLVNGLTGGQSGVENAADHVVNGAIGTALSLMDLINKAMEEDGDLEPTITPVLDLSNLAGAGTQIGGYFDRYGLNLNASANLASASQSNAPPSVTVQNPTDLGQLYSAIATLGEQIIGVQTAISNMQIVLNTGVIAGGVSDDVDVNLGRKGLYASRRN